MLPTGVLPQVGSRWAWARQLKLLGAALVLLGLVLPLYSCRGRFLDTAGREVRYVDQRGIALESVDLRSPLPPGVIRLEPDMTPPPGVRHHKNYHYFFSDFSVEDGVDWFRLGGFLWPMAAAAFADRLKRRWSRRLFLGLEPVLVLETALTVAISAMLGTKESGFWVAWSGAILYGLGAAWADLTALFLWKPHLGRGEKALGATLIFGTFLACSWLSVMVFFKWSLR